MYILEVFNTPALNIQLQNTRITECFIYNKSPIYIQQSNFNLYVALI